MTSRPAPVWIATRRVVFVHPDGHRVSGNIAIGQPYVLGGGPPGLSYEACCPVEITDLYAADLPPTGGGELNALVHALDLVRTLLQAFAADGGRLLDGEDGKTEISVELMFAALQQRR